MNQDEYEHVEKLIINSAGRFQIPGEPLEATNVLQQSILTIDDSPIFLRQYRFPPVHKEEITEQVDELLKNKIIKPSQLLSNTPVWIVPKKPHSKGHIKLQMVLDFRKPIEETIGDSYLWLYYNKLLLHKIDKIKMAGTSREISSVMTSAANNYNTRLD